MKKSEKLFRSLGSVRDEWLEDAIAEDISKKKIKATGGGKSVALRRILVAAAVCVLSVSLAITCFANADLIKSLFQREQELINPYAAIIEETTEAEGVTMRVDKVARDGDRYIVYLHLSRPEGFEAGYLTYGRFEIEQMTKDGWRPNTDLAGTNDPATALLAALFLTEVKEKTQELDILVTIDGILSQFYDYEENKYRITVKNLSTVELVEENGGTARYSAKYADELILEFEFDEADIEPLPEKVSYPDIDFEVDGSKFKLTEIRYSPMHLEIHIEDPFGQTFELGGKQLFATDKLSSSTYSVDAPLTRYPYQSGIHVYEDGELEEIRKRNEEHMRWTEENRAELLASWYRVEVETILEDRWSYGLTYEIENGQFNMNKLIITWRFSKPMYEEDIRSISFVNYTPEEYPLTEDTKFIEDRVVVWEQMAADADDYE